MAQTKPDESKRGAGVPSCSARAASTAAPLSDESAGTHTALTGDPSPKSTTTATVTPEKVDELTAHGAALARGAGAKNSTPVATSDAATNPRRFTRVAVSEPRRVARAPRREGPARVRRPLRRSTRCRCGP